MESHVTEASHPVETTSSAAPVAEPVAEAEAPELRMAPPAHPSPQLQSSAPGGLQMQRAQTPPQAPQPQQVTAPAATAQAVQAEPKQAPQQHTQPASSLMRVQSSSSVPQRREPSSRSFNVATPKHEAHATPTSGKSKKSALLTGLIIVVSVAAGAVLGSFILSIL